MSSRRLQGHSTSQPRVLRLLNYLGILNLVGIIAILLSEHSFHANHAREQTGPWLISNGKQNPTFIHTNEYKTGRKKNRHKGVNVTLLVLEKAGITIPLDYPRIPPWWWIEDQYGDRPTILGLDRCQQFQQINQNHSHKIQIAPTGLFNSGTNFLHQLLQQNCYFPHRPTNFYHGRAFQPPWGKHTPREARETHRIDHPIYQDMILDAVLPIVLIRHPYDWLKSTCEQPYAVHWRDRDENNTRFFKCPAIVRPNNQTQPVLVTYGSGNILYESVAHLWNRWNRAYFDSIAFPRIMIRMEDLIFYPQLVIPQICKCAGGSLIHPYKVLVTLDSAKKDTPGHPQRQSTSYLQAIIKYGNYRTWERFPLQDLVAARAILDRELMETFGYEHPNLDQRLRHAAEHV